MSGNLNPNLFRLSLPEWLKEQVSSGNHKSVYWIDEKEKVFHVPWKHASRNGWEDGDVSLFKAWAIYTNRYREGIDKPKPALWKTNFRCAINSHNHIFFVKDQGERRGDQAHRIMKIVDQENCKPNARESNPWDTMKKRVRMTYPSAGEPTRKRTKGSSKMTICENCQNNNSEFCSKCRVDNDNNNSIQLTHPELAYKFDNNSSSSSASLYSNEQPHIPMRKPNLQDLCQALKSIDEPSFAMDPNQSPSMSGNMTFKQEEYEHNSTFFNPNVKQEMTENMTMPQFTVRSTQTPVIVSNRNSLAMHQPTDSDYDSRSCSSDVDDDELIMPRISP